MIKEYFTDGLIGLAILLSLFRTDLLSLNLNNLINYPEVQDIIQGQTTAYLPTNFHSIQQSPYTPSLKHIELDNDALSEWYQNVNNLLRFRHERHNDEIEAFLVSSSQIVASESPIDHSPSDIPESSAESSASQNSLQLLNSATSSVNSTDVLNQRASSTGVVSNEEILNRNDEIPPTDNPFPGCNLTFEVCNSFLC